MDLSAITKTFESALSLKEAINELAIRRRETRELVASLQTLAEELESLRQASNNHCLRVVALDLPLAHCLAACEAFHADSNIIWADTTRSHDIWSFKYMLNIYEATIKVVVGHIAIWTISRDAPAIEAHEKLIDNTIVDLEDRLHQIKEGIQSYPAIEDAANRSQQLIQKEEHNSVEHCLLICREIKRNMEMLGLREHMAGVVKIFEKAVKLTSDNPAQYSHVRRMWMNLEADGENFVAKSTPVNVDRVLEDLNTTQVIVQRV